MLARMKRCGCCKRSYPSWSWPPIGFGGRGEGPAAEPAASCAGRQPLRAMQVLIKSAQLFVRGAERRGLELYDRGNDYGIQVLRAARTERRTR